MDADAYATIVTHGKYLHASDPKALEDRAMESLDAEARGAAVIHEPLENLWRWMFSRLRRSSSPFWGLKGSLRT